MWTMLCERGKDLHVDWRDVAADDAAGARALGAALHLLGHRAAGAQRDRRAFTFRDGQIATHVDRFDLWRWIRMALGAKGALLGWPPFVPASAIQRQARRDWTRGSRSRPASDRGAIRSTDTMAAHGPRA